MRLHFFKNETHFHLRISYIWENAEKVELDSTLQRFRKYIVLFWFAFTIIFAIFYAKELYENILLHALTFILILPFHELCHVIFCWFSGRKVERIYFFPYKFFFELGAYVKPAFGVWSKTQALFFSAFPLLLLTVVPLVLAIFLSSCREWLLFLALLNFGTSSFDIIDIFRLLKLPRNCLYFDAFALQEKDVEKPIIIHQLSLKSKRNEITHKCYQYWDNQLVELEDLFETEGVKRLKQEFAEQFDLK